MIFMRSLCYEFYTFRRLNSIDIARSIRSEFIEDIRYAKTEKTRILDLFSTNGFKNNTLYDELSLP